MRGEAGRKGEWRPPGEGNQGQQWRQERRAAGTNQGALGPDSSIPESERPEGHGAPTLEEARSRPLSEPSDLSKLRPLLASAPIPGAQGSRCGLGLMQKAGRSPGHAPQGLAV